jgi:hypothetical protein
MIVLLNGRARHQVITISSAEASNQKKSVSWACKSQSLTGRLHCQQGTRYFTIQPADPETAR